MVVARRPRNEEVRRVLRSAAIHRSGWQDFFVKRELEYVPSGMDRYFMLVVKALGSFMGSMAVALGAIAPVVMKSENFSSTDYGHFVGGVGILAALVALTAAQIADKFTRIRILLWGMILPVVFHFLMAFMPSGHRGLFIFYYIVLGITETWAIVTVSALLRDFSPRTGRALGVGLVTIGSQAALWLSFFLTGHLLNRVGTWQHMFLIYGFITLGCWVILLLFGREPSKGIRAQIVYSHADAQRVEQRARVLEAEGVQVHGFLSFLMSDPRLWLLAVGEGLFLIGYSTFVAFGPVFTVAVYKRSPQDASNLTSFLFGAILIGLFAGGVLSDKLRMRKIPGMVFTTIGGIFLIVLGRTVGHQLSNAQIITLFSIEGFFMAMMWSPTNALFSENAEDIAATRQTTGFGVAGFITGVMIQTWVFFALDLEKAIGWSGIWTVAGSFSIATAVVIALCKGTWGRFSIEAPTEGEPPFEIALETATELP
jgi:MFS family permease